MRISVIIPSLNEAERIRATLLPLQPGRAAGSHQILLVDGGSSDGTVDIAAPLVDDVLSCQAGRASQMIDGAQSATGEILWFLHADTIPTEISLQTIVDTVGTAESALCWGRFDIAIDDSGRWFRIIERMMNMRSRMTSVVTGDQGMFVTRSLYADIGGFKMLPLMEDVEISKRLRSRCKPACISEPLTTSARRWQKSGVIRTVLHMWSIRLGYVLGVTPARLARWYYPDIQRERVTPTAEKF